MSISRASGSHAFDQNTLFALLIMSFSPLINTVIREITE